MQHLPAGRVKTYTQHAAIRELPVLPDFPIRQRIQLVLVYIYHTLRWKGFNGKIVGFQSWRSGIIGFTAIKPYK
jgi:hypothetical protein